MQRLWLKAYHLLHEISTWTTPMVAVEEKFRADDHRKYMKQLLSLKEHGTVWRSISYNLSRIIQ
jgi:hypothetical protein